MSTRAPDHLCLNRFSGALSRSANRLPAHQLELAVALADIDNRGDIEL